MEREGFKTELQSAFNESVRVIVEQNKQFLNTIFEPNTYNGDVYSVIYFAPLWETDIQVMCKYHPLCKLEDGGRWLNKWEHRTLYDMRRKVFLISRKVICPRCDSHFKSHDLHILEHLPNYMMPSFLLFHKEGITKRTVDLIWNSVANGN